MAVRVTGTPAPDAPGTVIVRVPATGPQGATGATGPAGPTFNGGTVTNPITAPEYKLTAVTPDPAKELQKDTTTGQLFFGRYSLAKVLNYTRTITKGDALTSYWELCELSFGQSLQGYLTVDVVHYGSSAGTSGSYMLPISFTMDWLHSGSNTYGYTSGTNPFASGAWVNLTPTIWTGRGGTWNDGGCELQARAYYSGSDRIQLRLLKSAALGNNVSSRVSIRHSGDFRGVTVTDMTGTGTDATSFPKLPNLIGAKASALNAIWGSLGVRTNAPAYPLDVNGQAIFRDSVGFHGATPSGKPTVTGSRGGNAALASLLSALAGKGLITDGTTA